MFNKNKIILFTNLDAAQKSVIDAIFNNDIVSVCGAAGTGKTTVIINLVLNYILQNQEVYYLHFFHNLYILLNIHQIL